MNQQPIIIDKSFLHWTREDLEAELNIVQKRGLPALQKWLGMEAIVTEDEENYLEELRKEADYYIDYWNETELREELISVITRMVKFKNPEYKISTFAERSLEVKLQVGTADVRLHGIVDWLTATGWRLPKAPFFFIHEYKAVPGKVVDGPAQLLATMYAAQVVNRIPPKPTNLDANPIHFYKDIPIYGAYVHGRSWYFLALKGNCYDISEGYLFTNKGVPNKVLKHLKTQKQIIHSYFTKN